VQKGFSLIEVVVVLFVISLLTTNVLTLISAQRQWQKIQDTKTTLIEIEDALLGFAAIHGYLPYPASNPETGIQDKKLNGKEAYLAWADLGVNSHDQWGNYFRYRVETEYSEKSFDFKKIFGIIGSGSGLRIRDKQGNYLTVKSGDSRVAAIIFSVGSNGIADDDNSNRLKKTYVYDQYQKHSFDDILIYLSRNILIKYLNIYYEI
jgi:prepilin-type N-terminal cleavage/methylation domain-containing protein